MAALQKKLKASRREPSGKPDGISDEYAVVEGTRLLTANSYAIEKRLLRRIVVRDLTEGLDSLQNYTNFYPILVDFISNDRERIAVRKEEILEHEWERCEELGRTQMEVSDGRYRDGRPARSGIPARV